jgi:hypothetical protein
MKSIFEEYYDSRDFIDRFIQNSDKAVSVIIPTIHTNELWEANLYSIYREIPVKELLIGDGGCIDDSIAVALKFPRVIIHDHRNYKSLGFSIRKLIEAVDAEWFIYLHSDVFLPRGWFDEMSRHQPNYDWFGCRMRQTIMVEHDNDYGERPYAGSQIGRKEAFVKGLSSIDDDYVWRQEDFVLSEIVKSGGFREGKINDIFHYHQTMEKYSPVHNPKRFGFSFSAALSGQEEIHALNTQARGIIKYLSPSSRWANRVAGHAVYRLFQLKHCPPKDMYSWILNVNSDWYWPIKKSVLKLRFFYLISGIMNKIKAPFLRLLD